MAAYSFHNVNLLMPLLAMLGDWGFEALETRDVVSVLKDGMGRNT